MRITHVWKEAPGKSNSLIAIICVGIVAINVIVSKSSIAVIVSESLIAMSVSESSIAMSVSESSIAMSVSESSIAALIRAGLEIGAPVGEVSWKLTEGDEGSAFSVILG